jgi:hypothetical protein
VKRPWLTTSLTVLSLLAEDALIYSFAGAACLLVFSTGVAAGALVVMIFEDLFRL